MDNDHDNAAANDDYDIASVDDQNEDDDDGDDKNDDSYDVKVVDRFFFVFRIFCVFISCDVKNLFDDVDGN